MAEMAGMATKILVEEETVELSYKQAPRMFLEKQGNDLH